VGSTADPYGRNLGFLDRGIIYIIIIIITIIILLSGPSGG
jgi:hypothetical protein